jgi:hypothetical protein
MPLVPIDSSVQRNPSASPMRSACRRAPQEPSLHNTCPSASLITMRCAEASAIPRNVSRSMGRCRSSGWHCLMPASSSASNTSGAERNSGSTPAASDRRHESATMSRSPSGARTTGEGRSQFAIASRAWLLRIKGVSVVRVVSSSIDGSGSGCNPIRKTSTCLLLRAAIE